ncbi:MAG TPA: DUF1043 family protein [Thauera sp.]|nr:DUF1043 family protein [Thauera sp.]
MSAQTAWLVGIFAVVITGVIAFFVGRQFGAGKTRIEELEAEVARQKGEIEDYRKDVATHFDKTATLFVSMAGSYKELFEHLSSGYEKLSSGSARELFQQRVDALLVGNSPAAGDDNKLLTGAGLAAAAAAAGTAVASTGERETDPRATSDAGDEVGAGNDADQTSTQAAAEAGQVGIDSSVAESTASELAASERVVSELAQAGQAEAERAEAVQAGVEPAVATEAEPAPATVAEARTDQPALADDPLAEEVVGHHPPPRDQAR